MNTFTNYQSNPKHFQYPLDLLSKLERHYAYCLGVEDFEILHSNAITSALQFVEDPTKENLNGVIQFLKALDDTDYIDEKASDTVNHLMLILKELTFEDQPIFIKHFSHLLDDKMYLHFQMKMKPLTDYWWYKWQS